MTNVSSDIKLEKSSSHKVEPESHNWLNPIDLMDEWLNEVGFETFWPLARARALPMLRSSLHFRGPSVDIIDRDEEICVKAEIPGMDKKNLSIALQNRVLTLKGSAHEEKEEEKGQYFRRELQQGEWTRALLLPAEVDTRKCKAHFKDGLLEILLPKTVGANNGTQIAID